MRALRLLAVVFALLIVPTITRAAELVVHEWGTFTSFQDETGLAFTGINAEDEPLPDFCHKIRWSGVIGSSGGPESKATSRRHPDMTMQMETQVAYVHPPQHTKLAV